LSSSSPTKSKPGRPVGSDREENITRILEAALKHFASKGFSDTTFMDVAKDVGFTRSAMYPYYGNKVELYHALLNRLQKTHEQELQSQLEGDAPFIEKLESIFKVFVEDHEEHINRSTFLASVPLEMARHPELLESYSLQSSTPDMLKRFFQQAIEQKEITDQFSPEDLVVLFMGGTMGMSLFQRSMGIGRVSQSIDAFMAILNNQFLQNSESD